MLLWIFILGLTLAVVALALAPMLRPAREISELDHAIAFYEARKAELTSQWAGGQITQAEYDAAEAEQARRLLAISKTTPLAEAVPQMHLTRNRKLAAGFALVVLPVLALGIYLKVGNPAVPDQPLAARNVEPRNLNLESALAKIEAHLAKNPDDGRGYEVVAPVYLRAGRYDDAINAYRRIIALLGENAERWSDLGESIVAQQNGIVSAEARQAFERSVALDSDYAKSSFYLALAKEQDGDVPGAVAMLRAVLETLQDGPARMRVQAELDRLDPSGAKPSGPASEAGDAIAALPPSEREAAIRTMVDGLEQRLDKEGGGLNEWLRLARARMVLNEKEKVIAVLEKARKAFAADAAAHQQIDAFALSLFGAALAPAKP